MQYEAYQKRIGKLARILSRIVRRLPLIVTALAVALTASAAYLLLKGMVLGTSCPPQMRYGEAAAYESRVLFSGFSYEHCAQGEDVWREGTPVTAGKYRVRAVSENAFGKPRFGKPVEVEILPREITVGVTDTALFYGADFSLSGETAQGDRIVCEAFQFRRTSSASGDGLAAQYDVTPDGSRLLILDAQGRDVTGSYRILTQTASVTVTKLRITVTVPDAVKIYDGEKLTSERFEVTSGALCEGDRLVGSFTDSITMFGSVTNAPTFRIFSETGEDVTEYYAPEYVYGKLTVEKRPVAVTTGSLSGVYGGNAFSESSFTVDAEQAPIAGHTVRAVGEAPSFTEAGNHPNLMRFCITDGTGKDVTGNYELLVTAGTVAIAPRPLRVTTESREWQYDGKPHSADGYTADGLLSGHRFDIFDSFEATDVGEYENEILFEIRDGAGKDVTNNYEIVGDYGVCRITPCPVRIETKSMETVYDGTAHSYYGYTAHGVAQTHNVQIIRATEETEAGVYPNRMEFVIRDAAGRDVTFNYILSVSYGTLTVLPRPLYLTTYGKTWTYDGEEHSHPFYDVSGLADTHGATVAASASAVRAGEVPNVIEMKVFDQAGADVSKNYVTVPTYGTLRIEPRPVTARTFSGKWTYDSMPHGILGYDVISENGLADGDFLKIESAVTVTDVGTVRNVPTRFTVVGADGSDVSADYAVLWEYGTLEITPRPISLKPADRAKLYDGAPLRADAWEYAGDSEKGIVPWHTAALTYTGERTEIGESESAVVSVRITDGDADVTANYAITAGKGRLTVYGEGDAPVGEDGSGNGAPADDGFLDLRADLSADETQILGEVMTETSGALYLRKRSYGDYLKGIWTPGPAYERLLPDGDPYSFLASAALAASGLPARQISFRGMRESLLPTYPALGAMGGEGPKDDVSAGKLPEAYALPYYAPSAYPNPDGLVGRLGAYGVYEAMYAHEVSQNYLFVDGETRAYLEGVIREEGYSPSDPYVIKKIALYVRNAAEYRLDYDRAMDGEENIVVAFLEQYRQGDCRHFASAAVLLYRALGIPARYVEGYRVQAAADGYVPITGADAHAWAEVYIDGVGWMQVEVTEGAKAGDGDEKPAESKDKALLSIEPNYKSKVFDGEALTPAADDLKGNPLFAALLAEGYTYRATVSGSQTEVGQSASVIESFRLFDANGRDVTASYQIELGEGLLKVFPAEKSIARVYLYELQKYYDGAPFSFTQDDYAVVSIEEGAELSLTAQISLTDAGALSLSDLNGEIGSYLRYRVVKDGADVTERFLVEFVEIEGCGPSYMPIRIERRALALTAGSATKMYDGEALRCGDVLVSFGSLAQGHRVEARTEGSLTEIGKEENKIVSVKIRDENGADITRNYSISLHAGTLTVTAPESAVS